MDTTAGSLFQSLRYAVEVLDRGGYDLLTLGKKGEGVISAPLPKNPKNEKKNMVGDAGFEPATPAV